MSTNPSAAVRRFRPGIALGVLGLAALLFAGHRLGAGPWLRDGLDRVGRLGALAPIAFIAIYIAACVLFVPGSILTIGGGGLFGVLWGSIYVSIAATLGATAAFAIGRYFARDWVARRLQDTPRFAAIDRAVAREGWKIVALTRLSPVFPFNLLNYAFGLTSVRLADYVIASWAGMIPGTVLYVYLGSIGADVVRAGAGARVRTPAEWAFQVVGLLATIAVVAYVTRIAARALRERT
jgi:uncharacterized membrane protein YdjX (TVP38/TMEM64 family)